MSDGGGRLAVVAGARPCDRRMADDLAKAGFDARVVEDPGALGEAAAGAFVIVRWMGPEGDGLDDPVVSHVEHADGALAVLEAARAAQARRVVHAAPRQVGPPATPRAVQTLAAELYCGLYRRLHGLETVVLRYPPGLSDDDVARAIRRAALGDDGLDGVIEPTAEGS